MLTIETPFWKQAPFIRLVPPFFFGIIIQYEWDIQLATILLTILASIVLFVLVFFLPDWQEFLLHGAKGASIFLTLFSLGMLITWSENIRHRDNWMGKFNMSHCSILATLDESPIEKPNSYKAAATIDQLSLNDSIYPVYGKIIIYFKKDSAVGTRIKVGSRIVFDKQLQEIKNTGNPAAFDYKQYCFFQGITHQVFLTSKDFLLLQKKSGFHFNDWIENSKLSVIHIIRKYIKHDREAGVAEALLMGYRDDLDKTLVQAYANTGVVHIIAISGMHLALIYGILILLFKPFLANPKLKWAGYAAILMILWIFSLMAGGGPSILRSAVMFSFIVIADAFSKKSSIYNSMAASAFFLLCWNPFYLWDAGFQLSYAALTSIVIFSKGLSKCFYFRNKILESIWKLCAVTLSAQILTLPLSIFLFHQFPNFFLLANLVSVPVSGIILYGEILLCTFSFFPWLANYLGTLVEWLLVFMNRYIQWVNDIPYSVINNLQISLAQAILLYMLICFLSIWFLQKNKSVLKYAIICVIGIAMLRDFDILNKTSKSRIIVYNIPHHRGIDLMSNGQFQFLEDAKADERNAIEQYIVGPARRFYRVESEIKSSIYSPFILFEGKRILVLDSNFLFSPAQPRPDVDILIFSHNTKTEISNVQQAFSCGVFVFDASNSEWKIRKWKNECDSLLLRFHSVPDEGAFVLEF